jgi:hypothetical protein
VPVAGVQPGPGHGAADPHPLRAQPQGRPPHPREEEARQHGGQSFTL